MRQTKRKPDICRDLKTKRKKIHRNKFKDKKRQKNKETDIHT